MVIKRKFSWKVLLTISKTPVATRYHSACGPNNEVHDDGCFFQTRSIIYDAKKEMDFQASIIKRQNSSEYFDTVIGHIEDIVIGEEFQSMVNRFMECYYYEFEPGEENKIIYTEIYQKYTNMIEAHIVENLNRKMSCFDMDLFAMELENKKTQLDGEIFELLYTLTDFLAFKDMVLDYKAFKEGAYDDLSKGISVTGLQK